jgi:hypothetical protein
LIPSIRAIIWERASVTSTAREFSECCRGKEINFPCGRALNKLIREEKASFEEIIEYKQSLLCIFQKIYEIMLFHKVEEGSQYMQAKLFSGQVQNTYAFMTSYYNQNYMAYDTQLYYPQNSQQMMYYQTNAQIYGYVYPQKDEGYDSSLLNGDSAEEAQENFYEESMKMSDTFLEVRQSPYDKSMNNGLRFAEQSQKRKRGSSFDSS